MIYGDRKRRWLTWTLDLLPLALLAESFYPLIVERFGPRDFANYRDELFPSYPWALRDMARNLTLLFAMGWFLVRILPRIARATNLEKRTDLAITPRPPGEWLRDQLRAPLFRTLLPIPILSLTGVLVDLYLVRGKQDPIWFWLRLDAGVAFPAMIVVFLLRMTASIVIADCLWPKTKIGSRLVFMTIWVGPLIALTLRATGHAHKLSEFILEAYPVVAISATCAALAAMDLGRRWAMADAAYGIVEWDLSRSRVALESELSKLELWTKGRERRQFRGRLLRVSFPVLVFVGHLLAMPSVDAATDFDYATEAGKYMTGDPARAIRILTQGIERMPRNAVFLRYRAMSHARLHHFDLAATDHFAAARSFRFDTQLGIEELDLAGEASCAANDLRRTDEINDLIERQLEAVAASIRRKRPYEGMLGELWERPYGVIHRELHCRRGVVHFLRSQYPQALREFKQAAGVRGGSPLVASAIRQCLMIMGEEGNLESDSRGLDQRDSPSDAIMRVEARLDTAQNFLREGDFQQAYDCLRMLGLPVDQQGPEIWMYRAAAADGLGRTREAREAYANWPSDWRLGWRSYWPLLIRYHSAPPFLREYFDHDPHTDLADSPEATDAPTTGTLAAPPSGAAP